MVLVWKDNMLIRHLDVVDEAEAPSRSSGGAEPRAAQSVQVPRLLQKAQQQAGQGLLKGLLSKEKREREAVASSNAGNSRFKGVFRTAVQAPPEPRATDSDSPNKPAQSAPSLGRIFSNPFSTSDSALPQVKSKNSKKNLTFAVRRVLLAAG